MASKSLIILSLLLVCSVLVSSRHLEESIHKVEEKGAAHFGAEQVKDVTGRPYRALNPNHPVIPGRPGLPYRALNPNHPVIPGRSGRPYRGCPRVYGCPPLPL